MIVIPIRWLNYIKKQTCTSLYATQDFFPLLRFALDMKEEMIFRFLHVHNKTLVSHKSKDSCARHYIGSRNRYVTSRFGMRGSVWWEEWRRGYHTIYKNKITWLINSCHLWPDHALKFLKVLYRTFKLVTLFCIPSSSTNIFSTI